VGCCAAGDIGSVDLAQCVRFPGEAPAGMEQPEEPSGLLYSRGSDRTWLYDLEECDIGVLKIKKFLGEPVNGETWTDGTYAQLYPIRVIFLNGKVEDCVAWSDLQYRVKERRSKLK